MEISWAAYMGCWIGNKNEGQCHKKMGNLETWCRINAHVRATRAGLQGSWTREDARTRRVWMQGTRRFPGVERSWESKALESQRVWRGESSRESNACGSNQHFPTSQLYSKHKTLWLWVITLLIFRIDIKFAIILKFWLVWLFSMGGNIQLNL